MAHVRFSSDSLIRSATEALETVRVPTADATLVAHTLVDADQRGIYSHGLLRLPLYVAGVEAGGINPTPTFRWSGKTGAAATLDADSAFGQVAMNVAVDGAIERARTYGVACVAVENSVHYGAGGWWSNRLADAGMVGIVTSTTGPTVAPYGGTEAILGTNPLSISVPSADDHALTADMATSAGAYGKVLAARNAGETIPAGWAIDAGGLPTTDPVAAIAGALVPFGGHKGSAISVVLEALSASLTGANYAYQTTDIWSSPTHRMNTGHLVIAIDTEAFVGRDHTAQRTADLQARVRSTGEETLAPGDPEHSRRLAAADAVELAPATVAALEALFVRLGVASVSPVN